MQVREPIIFNLNAWKITFKVRLKIYAFLHESDDLRINQVIEASVVLVLE